ncbi:aldolase [Laetiporus sulphureus 93-53]|uniref:Aldolase n=1 Tax=Laetiporus sulphureus 93-53 TaxID=1314785 RepID=A0A165CFK0_9APHY|nr:aldolase [Laetiporus sulphureus 93-53]KZT02720.1 aldolase [Laetiporus sulphureus 93-53]
MTAGNLLTYIRAQVAVDVDSMDPAVAARHTTETVKFCDMTSNQAIVYVEAAKQDRASLLKAACAQAQASGVDGEQQVTNALDILTVLLAKEVYPYLTGRVHTETSPSAAYNTEETIAHAKRLVALFEANGIPKSRVCIKIPATPESIVACQHLETIGISTLATCLFSVPQAVAASQAGCRYIAPYLNQLRVHIQPELWKEYKDTANEHPGARIIASIVNVYKSIGSKTLVMPASIVTSTEAVALVSLHPDHLTLSGAVLDQLIATEQTASTPNDPKPHHPEVGLNADSSIIETDFLANGADALRAALSVDAESTRNLADALKIFDEMEQKTKELIRKELNLV